MIPACGPPSSLSPLKVTKSTPLLNTSAAVGSCSPPPKAAVAQGQDEGGGAVVDDGGGLGAAEDGEVVLEVTGACAALAAGQVVLEVVVVGGDVAECLDDRRPERRSAEVGVNNDPGPVDDRL